MKNFRKLLEVFYPLIITFGITLWLIYETYREIIDINWGHFAYSVDDTYIILAMAKNFANHGIWGISPFEIASASSTILYTLSISVIYKITGTLEFLPLILNISFTLIFLGMSYWILRSSKVPNILNVIALILILFVTPLITLIFIGMEHILHIITSLLVLYLGSRVICEDTLKKYELVSFYIAGVILPLVRYEGFFLILPIFLLILARRKFKTGIIFLISCIIPIGIFGVVSLAYGQLFLPNSVYVKSGISSFSIPVLLEKLGILFPKLYFVLPILLIFIIMGILFLLALYHKKRLFWNSGAIFLLLALTTALFHVWVGQIGMFFRYDAYLHPLVILGIFINLPELFPSLKSSSERKPDDKSPDKKVTNTGGKIRLNAYRKSGGKDVNNRTRISRYTIYFAFFVFLFLLAIPGISPIVRVNSVLYTPLATHNIYEQQYQMGLFISEYYQNETIFLNDIGAPTFLADIHLIDRNGLGTTEVARNYVVRNSSFNLYEYARARGAKIAIIYDSDPGTVDPEWIFTGRWTIRNNVICYRDSVGIYAIYPEEQERLILNLKQFSGKLPRDVIQSGPYMEV